MSKAMKDRPLNLKTKTGAKAFEEQSSEGRTHVSIEEFLRGQECTLLHGTNKLFPCFDDCGSHTIVLANNRFVAARVSLSPSEYFDNRIKNAVESSAPPSAILVESKKKPDGLKRLMLVNGDQNGNDDPELSFVDEFSDLGLPTTSFACLERFFKENEGLKRLCNGHMKVVDYTTDERRPLSDEDKKLLARKKNNRPKPPEPGFTLVGREWHRSGTVLLQDQERKMCILMGQDEGTYFGVELPKMAKSIADAFQILIPKEVVEKEFTRQGEWFMTPVADEDVPEHANCVACDDCSIILPLESADSNHHRVESSDVRIGKDGQVYAHNPNVEHDDHASISGYGWFTFYRNTALRSYSQEGVD